MICHMFVSKSFLLSAAEQNENEFARIGSGQI